MARQVFFKVCVADIASGGLVEGSESVPSHVEIRGRAVARVNIVGTVVSRDVDGGELIIDDGTGSIRVRVFESPGRVAGFEAGSVISVLGRIRHYGSERYISADILRGDVKEFLLLRQLELRSEGIVSSEPSPASPAAGGVEEQVVDDSEGMQLIQLIRELDRTNSGNGADLLEVCRLSRVEDSAGVVRGLLQMGEVFEIRPGRLKVLE